MNKKVSKFTLYSVLIFGICVVPISGAAEARDDRMAVKREMKEQKGENLKTLREAEKKIFAERVKTKSSLVVETQVSEEQGKIRSALLQEKEAVREALQSR